MAGISRRQLLAGTLAIAGVTITADLSRKTPAAEARPFVKEKYYYSLNPLTNTHRYGYLIAPRTSNKKVPVAVLVHGGSWEAGPDTYSMSYVAERLAANNVAVWNIDYRSLGNGGGWPTTYADVCDAIDHLIVLKLLVAPMLDLNRVYLVGHSAGAQLAALAAGQASDKVDIAGLLATTEIIRGAQKEAQLATLRADGIGKLTDTLNNGKDSNPFANISSDPSKSSQMRVRSEVYGKNSDTAGPSSQHGTNRPSHYLVGTGNEAGKRTVAPTGPRIPIRGLVSLNGVLDVVDSARRSRASNIREFLGGSPKEVPGNYYAANPIKHLPRGIKIRVLQGSRDGVIPHGQGLSYVRAARKAGNHAQFVNVPGGKHNDFVNPRRNPEVFQLGVDHILRTMGKGPDRYTLFDNILGSTRK